MAVETSKNQDPRRPPRRFSNARIRAFAALERGARALGGRAHYRRRHLAAGRFGLREERLEVAALPSGLEGLCVVHLSDLHAGPFLGPGDLSDVVRAANDQGPDLVFLTGDLVTHGWQDALSVLDDLGGLRPRLATLAVFGNHDYRGREEGKIEQAFAARGIRFLRNAGWLHDSGAGRLAVVGLEDLEEARWIDVQAARAGTEEAEVELVLSHNPWGGPLMASERCAAVFSGHTHGGQVDLPLARGLGPAHPGSRVRLGSTTLIVSRGLGCIGLPLRVGAPSELVVARLAGGGC